MRAMPASPTSTVGAPVEWIRCPLDQACTMQLGDMPGNGGGIQVCADGQVGDA